MANTRNLSERRQAIERNLVELRAARGAALLDAASMQLGDFGCGLSKHSARSHSVAEFWYFWES